MRTNLITRLKEEWNNLDPVDPLRGLIADAIDALAEAQQQEPVCDKDPRGCWSVRCQLGKVCKNTSPPAQRKPLPEDYTALEQALTRLQKRYADLEGRASKPLTDEEIKRMAAPLFMSHYWNLCNEFARAIEAKLRERNEHGEKNA